LIGSAICKEAVKQGWEVVILSRRSLPGGISWNPEKSEIDISSPRSFDAIINLAGSSIAGGRWTTARIKEIHDSRVNDCNTIEKYLDKGADFILIGEAEITLKELINALEAQEKNFASIQGLAFRQHGTTIKTLKRNVIKELDQLLQQKVAEPLVKQ